MDYDVIPNDVAQFIVKRIDSIAQLEGLLILRSDPTVAWSVEVLARRLYISENETAELMSRLCTDGFLITKSNKPLRYQYHPNSTKLKAMIDRLAEIYSKHLVPVTNLIHSKSKSRVQEFADAFRLRKEE